MVAATANTAKSKTSAPEPMEAFRRSDIRKMKLRTAFVAVALTLIGTNQALKYFGENTVEKAYLQGMKCAQTAAANAFEARKFDKDQIAKQIYQSDMSNCLSQGPR